MGVVFAKTDKGLLEITERTAGLHPRVRRVLILIDGKRTVDEIRELAIADDLTHTLAVLEEECFIEVASVRKDSGETVEVDGPLPSITAFRELPDPVDPKETEMARHFMMNTLRTFCGQYSHVTLQSTIFSAKGHEELRLLFPDWYRHIVDTRQGRRRAEELRGQLLKVI